MTIVVANFPTPVDAGSASSVTSSPTFTSTTGNLLIGLGVATGNAGLGVGSPAFSDTGSTNTFSTGHNLAWTDAGGYVIAIEWVANITGQSGEAVTWTINQSQFPSTSCIEASGCDTASPNDVAPSWQHQPGNLAQTLNSSLITPAAGDHLLVVVALADSNATNLSVANNGTGAATWNSKVDNTISNEPIIVSYAIVTANGTNTYGVTVNSGDAAKPRIGVGIAAFKASGGAAPSPIEPPMRTLRGVGL